MQPCDAKADFKKVFHQLFDDFLSLVQQDADSEKL